MNCQTVRPLLMDDVNTALPAEQQAAVDAHLQGCESCRAERADIERLLTLLRAQTVPQPPARRWAMLQYTVLAEMARRTPPSKPIRRRAPSLLPWWTWSAAAAALLLWLVWTPVTQRLLPHRSSSQSDSADGSNTLGPLIAEMMTTTPSVLNGLDEGPGSSPLEGLDQLDLDEVQHVEHSLGNL
ncbi:MAG TPA: zf-HC2 domain-containing protein [Nitrospiria bacterium]|nr:zf-HC2 domain-containing protein [Nitrospiria bacterium]